MGNAEATSSSQPPSPDHEFTMHFPASPQGASLARRLAASRLREWGYSTDVPALLIGELVANAVEHCHSPEGQFRLRVTATAALLIEVSDVCGTHLPALQQPSEDAESGRGILLVDVLAGEWGTRVDAAPREGKDAAPREGKTVWCTCALSAAPYGTAPERRVRDGNQGG
ncbi:ATP-binding protein [Streptomyces iconiensis]|uniref:ATP-binding protein n=1 Tax=Streptomyces iconiensis TaxID=1384038 RepID=A0ABT6ZWH6_9ACTN|nr:ATP-binding protein [Streptomyces iconiensis]MDJ1133409.1 ATP-binding protein [Streptomyces iconiensis]